MKAIWHKPGAWPIQQVKDASQYFYLKLLAGCVMKSKSRIMKEPIQSTPITSLSSSAYAASELRIARLFKLKAIIEGRRGDWIMKSFSLEFSALHYKNAGKIKAAIASLSDVMAMVDKKLINLQNYHCRIAEETATLLSSIGRHCEAGKMFEKTYGYSNRLVHRTVIASKAASEFKAAGCVVECKKWEDLANFLASSEEMRIYVAHMRLDYVMDCISLGFFLEAAKNLLEIMQTAPKDKGVQFRIEFVLNNLCNTDPNANESIEFLLAKMN
jgi:hypothetical protein